MVSEFKIKSDEQGTVGDIRVINSAYSVIEPDILVIPDESIQIEYTYPLGKLARLSFNHAGGFNRRQVFSCIQEGYQEIYAEPARYEVWGHALIDLYVEGCSYADGVLKLTMGS